MTSPFWDWALSAYAKPGVSEACLILQDHFEQNVPVLLWGAWNAASGRKPDDETLEAACDMARAYDRVVVAPLREMRRTLKSPVPDIETEHRQALRDQVKALELDAERRLMLELATLSPTASSAPRRLLDGLAETARHWDAVVPRPALTTLSERLSA